jgi:hypothetical protein|tara:strand:- start:246 stop:794 length:549 start_codon:yes stop_codon:yes gene_type:complete
MDFIEIYDNVYSKEECKNIIDAFESDSNKHAGLSDGGRIREKLKKSVDLGVFTNQVNFYNNILLPKMPLYIGKYKNKYPALDNNVEKWSMTSTYNIQKYGDGDGYFDTHCEHCKNFPKRILAWMVYLNDAKCGTKFIQQKRVTKARRGRLVVWPAFWTHTHCGVTPNRGEKYIATGWFELNN